MFGAAFDTAIGLVLVFLLYSILLTIVMEIVSGALRLRSRALENAIAKLIEDPGTAAGWGKLAGMFGAHTMSALAGHKDAAAPPVLPYTRIYNHPMVAGISNRDKPSYVPGSSFASALVQVLGKLGGGKAFTHVEAGVARLPPGDLRTALETLLAEAKNDIDRLRTGVELWFDSAMDRLTGGYKRFTQLVTFAAGLVLAVACNVDAVAIGQRLYVEPTLRANVAALAQIEAKGPAPKPGSEGSTPTPGQFQAAEQKLEKTQLVGWPKTNATAWSAWPLLGWLITALAGLMGAPFWFDTLKSLVNIRNAGPKPDSSTDTKK